MVGKSEDFQGCNCHAGGARLVNRQQPLSDWSCGPASPDGWRDGSLPAHCSKTDGKPLSQSGMLACCQGLLSSDLDTGKEKASSGFLVFAIELFVIGLFVFPKVQKRILPNTEYDTGPPSPDFLVETVLRRSLCENAPPGLS